MIPRLFLDLDPKTLRLPWSRSTGADVYKLQRQIARYGTATAGMPAIEVTRGSDGEYVIGDGVTRATRVAKLLPGTLVRVEVIDVLPVPLGSYPKLGDLLP